MNTDSARRPALGRVGGLIAGGIGTLIIVGAASLAVASAGAAHPSLGVSDLERLVVEHEQRETLNCLSDRGFTVSPPDPHDDEWVANLGLDDNQTGMRALMGDGDTGTWVRLHTQEGTTFMATQSGCLAQARVSSYGSIENWLALEFLPQVAAAYDGGFDSWQQDYPADAELLSEALESVGGMHDSR